MNRFGWGFLLLVGGIFTLALCSREGVSLDRQAGLPPSREHGVFMVPVKGVTPAQLVDSWNDPRDNGLRVHQALDIPAPGGTPVLAAFAGTVVKLFTSKAGGLTLYVRAGDIQAYYAHLSGYAPGLREGQQVTAGQTIAFVGDTGNAGAGNTHLHFALHSMTPADRWWQGTPVNPYPVLTASTGRR